MVSATKTGFSIDLHKIDLHKMAQESRKTMFPMRDHHYELAKIRQIELLEVARKEQELRRAFNYQYEVWSLKSLRRLLKKIHLPASNGKAAGSSQGLPPVNVIEG